MKRILVTSILCYASLLLAMVWGLNWWQAVIVITLGGFAGRAGKRGSNV